MSFDMQKFEKSMKNRLKKEYDTQQYKDRQDVYDALAASVLDSITENWIKTRYIYEKNKVRQVYYLSAEFLMGRALSNNLINLLIKRETIQVLKNLGFDYNDIEDQEPDAGLGNGGLGRLAACFLDSLATRNYPACGYGIRYRYGMFEQRIENGFQVEYPDNWLKYRDPWEVRRRDLSVEVLFGGNVSVRRRQDGTDSFFVENAERITATPYDTPIIGYGTNTVNTLRLWEASSPEGFDLQLFNAMHYKRAVEKQNSAEDISRVLYPNDSGPSGKALRLKQQYFFCSASLQDMLRSFKVVHGENFSDFSKYHVIQLNDTHPVVAIPELMRLLMDEHNLGWDEAWKIVTQSFAYTNHTILAEALEKWPIDIFRGLLPRVYQIVEEINRRFIADLRSRFAEDYDKQNRMSIIQNGMIYMAWLAIHACFSVNGVAALHSEILRTQELKDWAEIYPEKFNNKTNGVTQRRWLLNANPRLASFVTKYAGCGWETDLSMLKNLEKYAENKAVLTELLEIKQKNKEDLALWLKNTQNEFLDPQSIFDVQIKRLHEYKRQLLNILHVIYLYNRILDEPEFETPARTFIFGAKAASGYRRAKTIIKLINAVAARINNDKRVCDKIRVVFIENYRVSAAEKIFPAADVSEQISTAGKEASGTGNMKFMLNGALTLGTFDGANIEIIEEVHQENAFIFGLKADEILEIQKAQSYNPQLYIDRNPYLAKVLHQLTDGSFCEEHGLFQELYDSLVCGVDGQRPDVYYVLADFDAYCTAQQKVAACYTDRLLWAQKALLNIARCGKFSSDRTIEEYVQDIWKLTKTEIR